MTIRFNNNFGKEILRRYDARTESPQYGNLLRSLRRSPKGTAAQSQINGRASRRIGRRFVQYNIFLGGVANVSGRRLIAEYRFNAQFEGCFQTLSERIKFYKTQNSPLDFCFEFCKINSVESDGVRLIFLTARDGAAFLTVRDAVVGRFFLPFLSVESVGRSPEFPMSQAAPKERVRRRRVEPLREEEYRRNFETIVDLCRVALAVQEQMLLADFERRAIFRETTRLIRERLERLRQRQLEDARDWPSDEVCGVPQASSR